MVKVLQQNTWIDDRFFLKSCLRARAEQDNINHPAYGTWTADLMLRQNESRAFLGKYLTLNSHAWWRLHKAGVVSITSSTKGCQEGRHLLAGRAGQEQIHQKGHKPEDAVVAFILFAFITGNSCLEPLVGGLLAQIHMDLSFRGFGWNQTGHLRITHISVRCQALICRAKVMNESL